MFANRIDVATQPVELFRDPPLQLPFQCARECLPFIDEIALLPRIGGQIEELARRRPIAVRLARADFSDYFALKWPAARHLTFGIAALVVLIAAGDALLYLTGRDLVTAFQVQSYTTAAAAGWVPAMLAAAILIAPAGEDVVFRGFLFRGWARSPRSVWPAIVVISILWAILHIQYDWTGVFQIFVIGLFLGWTRWRSGSLVLTFILHSLFNLEGTLETLALIHFAK